MPAVIKNKRKPFTWQGLFHLLSKVDSPDPNIQRKGQLLALFIGLCWVLLLYSLLNTLVIYIITPSQEYLFYLIQSFLVFIPFHIFWWMNQKGQVLFAAKISISFIIIFGAVLSDVKYMEYLMVVFALRCAISSTAC